MPDTDLPTTVDLVKHANVPTVEVVHSVHAERRPARHRLGDPDKVHCLNLSGVQLRPQRPTLRGEEPKRPILARLFRGGVA